MPPCPLTVRPARSCVSRRVRPSAHFPSHVRAIASPSVRAHARSPSPAAIPVSRERAPPSVSSSAVCVKKRVLACVRARRAVGNECACAGSGTRCACARVRTRRCVCASSYT
eukprot:3581461-Pleurochrysis_carterae.AAC.1